MKVKNRWVLLLLLIVCLVVLWMIGRQQTHYAPFDAPSASTSSTGATTVGFAGTGELLLDLVDDVTADQVRALEKRYGLSLKLNSVFSKAGKLYRSAKLSPERLKQVLVALKKEPLVELAEPDQLYSLPLAVASATSAGDTAAQVAGFPNDPQYRYQWHLDQVGMKAAWKKNQGAGVIVAVIDTGVAFKDSGAKFKRVPDLAGTQFVPGYDFVNDQKDALDDHGHGTHVAGTIAQTTHNKIGVAGIAFKAKIMPLKVLSARGFGNVADIAEAVRFAADHGAKVINMSLGGPRPAKVLEQAVEYAYKKGVLVVCAAGNEGRGKVGYPAAYPKAFAVAATQFDKSTTFYSNWGKQIAIAAPGGNTRVDQNNDGMPDGVLQNTIKIGKPSENDYLLFMGTSMASPHVAGVAALVVASGVTRPDAVAKLLTSTAEHPKKVARDDHYGAGIVRADLALSKKDASWGALRLFSTALFGVFALAWLGRLRSAWLLLTPRVLLGMLLGGALSFVPLWLASIGLDLGAGSAGIFALDSWIFGATTPVFHSVLPLLLVCGLLYAVHPLRPLLFGLALAVASTLFFFAAFDVQDLRVIPDVLDAPFLLLNSALALLLAVRVFPARVAHS